ncbi:MAG: ABC transporter transmembrane domain-containing protein [Blautia sp.]
MAFLLTVGTGLGKVMVKKWEERQQAFSDLSDFAQESYSGIAVIKAFVKEYKELYAFRKLNKENEDTNVTYTRISTLLNIMVTLFVESVICVILGYGGYLVYQENSMPASWWSTSDISLRSCGRSWRFPCSLRKLPAARRP